MNRLRPEDKHRILPSISVGLLCAGYLAVAVAMSGEMEVISAVGVMAIVFVLGAAIAFAASTRARLGWAAIAICVTVMFLLSLQERLLKDVPARSPYALALPLVDVIVAILALRAVIRVMRAK
jgi:hypothetical protein